MATPTPRRPIGNYRAAMAELFLGGKVDPATHDRTGDDVRIDADDLTTHGVIVGMT